MRDNLLACGDVGDRCRVVGVGFPIFYVTEMVSAVKMAWKVFVEAFSLHTFGVFWHIRGFLRCLKKSRNVVK